MLDANIENEIKNKDLYEKLDIIESIADSSNINTNDLEILSCLSQDEEAEVRAKVAEVLVTPNSSEAERILVKLLNDKDELVRVNACDSLCNSSSKEVLELLKNRVRQDRSSLVRGYAVLSIADIANRVSSNNAEIVKFLESISEKEKVTWVKINFYKALYSLGEKAKIKNLLKELNNRLYRNRCATVNVLGDIISQENKRDIKEALQNRLKIEKTVAVKSSIEGILNNND